MTAKFICRDCDATVFAIGIDAPPASGRCSVCEWLAEFVPGPAERAAIQRRSLASEAPR